MMGTVWDLTQEGQNGMGWDGIENRTVQQK